MGREWVKISADGNCQFRSIAHQLGVSDTPSVVRKKVCDMLIEKHDQPYSEAAAGGVTRIWQVEHDSARGFIRVVNGMRRSTRQPEWGDETTLVGAAAAYGCRIQVISSNGVKYDRNIEPPIAWQIDITREIVIGHLPERHYVSTSI